MHSPKRLIVGILTVFLLCVGTGHARDFRSQALRVSQQVVGQGTPSSTYAAESVAVNFGSSEFGSDKATGKLISMPNPIGITPGNYGYGQYESQEILDRAKSYMTADLARQVGVRLRKAMSDNLTGSAVYTYEQMVWPKIVERVSQPRFRRFFWLFWPWRFNTTAATLAIRPMKLTWVISATDSGGIVVGEPQMVNPKPSVVKMVYYPLANDPNLPPEWNRDYAGYLTYQVQEKDGTPMTQEIVIDAQGAYDEDPQADNAELMVNCMANIATPGCPGKTFIPFFSNPAYSPYLDAKGLMRETASDSVVIEYYRTLRPKYHEVAAPGGGTEYVAMRNIYYQQRELTPNACNLFHYRNKGEYEWLIDDTFDTYTMSKDAPAVVKIGTESRDIASQKRPFDLEGQLTKSVIDFKDLVFSVLEYPQLDLVNEVHGLRYLAPLTNLYPKLGQAPISSISGGGYAQAGTSHTLNFGAQGLGNGTNTYSFNVSDKRMWSGFDLASYSFTGHTVLTINGTKLFLGPHSGTSIEPGQYCTTTPSSCPAGTSQSGNNCVSSSTVAATGSSTSTVAATWELVDYVCIPDGFWFPPSPLFPNDPVLCSALNGVESTAYPATEVYGYTCPSGWTLNGTTCSSSSTNTSLSCPSGYTLNGTVCTQSSSQPLPPPVTTCKPSVLYSGVDHYFDNGGGSMGSIGLLPYLVTGQNTISVQTVVYAGSSAGHALTLSGTSCLTDDPDAPKNPVNTSSPGSF